MPPEALQSWLEVVSMAAGLAGGLVAGLWAYSKYILERGLLPPTRFWLTCRSLGAQRGKHVLQVLFHLKNIGSSTLVASDVGLDLLYLEVDSDMNLLADPRRIGRLGFTKSLRRQLGIASVDTAPPTNQERTGAQRPKGRGIPLVPHDTFVQAGVHQSYTFVTAVPATTTLVLIRGSFKYAQAPTRFARVLLSLSRRLGLVQFTLSHVTEPHTTERAFSLTPQGQVDGLPNRGVGAAGPPTDC